MFGAKLRIGCGICEKPIVLTAPNPVICLWTGCTRLKMHGVTERDFLLTEFIEGVQQDRSLTAS
jgi:hypothetical protein